MSSDRRSFLKGVLVAVAGRRAISLGPLTMDPGTALVRLASPDEAENLSCREPVALGNVAPQFSPLGWSPEVYMRGPDGELRCVALVETITSRRDIIDVTTYADVHARLIPGAWHGSMDFTGKLEIGQVPRSRS